MGGEFRSSGSIGLLNRFFSGFLLRFLCADGGSMHSENEAECQENSNRTEGTAADAQDDLARKFRAVAKAGKGEDSAGFRDKHLAGGAETDCTRVRLTAW